jgi:hypothetical protein
MNKISDKIHKKEAAASLTLCNAKGRLAFRMTEIFKQMLKYFCHLTGQSRIVLAGPKKGRPITILLVAP